jgi:hypothetical protein
VLESNAAVTDIAPTEDEMSAVLQAVQAESAPAGDEDDFHDAEDA